MSLSFSHHQLRRPVREKPRRYPPVDKQRLDFLESRREDVTFDAGPVTYQPPFVTHASASGLEWLGMTEEELCRAYDKITQSTLPSTRRQGKGGQFITRAAMRSSRGARPRPREQLLQTVAASSLGMYQKPSRNANRAGDLGRSLTSGDYKVQRSSEATVIKLATRELLAQVQGQGRSRDRRREIFHAVRQALPDLTIPPACSVLMLSQMPPVMALAANDSSHGPDFLLIVSQALEARVSHLEQKSTDEMDTQQLVSHHALVATAKADALAFAIAANNVLPDFVGEAEKVREYQAAEANKKAMEQQQRLEKQERAKKKLHALEKRTIESVVTRLESSSNSRFAKDGSFLDKERMYSAVASGAHSRTRRDYALLLSLTVRLWSSDVEQIRAGASAFNYVKSNYLRWHRIVLPTAALRRVVCVEDDELAEFVLSDPTSVLPPADLVCGVLDAYASRNKGEHEGAQSYAARMSILDAALATLSSLRVAAREDADLSQAQVDVLADLEAVTAALGTLLATVLETAQVLFAAQLSCAEADAAEAVAQARAQRRWLRGSSRTIDQALMNARRSRPSATLLCFDTSEAESLSLLVHWLESRKTPSKPALYTLLSEYLPTKPRRSWSLSKCAQSLQTGLLAGWRGLLQALREHVAKFKSAAAEQQQAGAERLAEEGVVAEFVAVLFQRHVDTFFKSETDDTQRQKKIDEAQRRAVTLLSTIRISIVTQERLQRGIVLPVAQRHAQFFTAALNRVLKMQRAAAPAEHELEAHIDPADVAHVDALLLATARRIVALADSGVDEAGISVCRGLAERLVCLSDEVQPEGDREARAGIDLAAVEPSAVREELRRVLWRYKMRVVDPVVDMKHTGDSRRGAAEVVAAAANTQFIVEPNSDAAAVCANDVWQSAFLQTGKSMAPSSVKLDMSDYLTAGIFTGFVPVIKRERQILSVKGVGFVAPEREKVSAPDSIGSRVDRLLRHVREHRALVQERIRGRTIGELSKRRGEIVAEVSGLLKSAVESSVSFVEPSVRMLFDQIYASACAHVSQIVGDNTSEGVARQRAFRVPADFGPDLKRAAGTQGGPKYEYDGVHLPARFIRVRPVQDGQVQREQGGARHGHAFDLSVYQYDRADDDDLPQPDCTLRLLLDGETARLLAEHSKPYLRRTARLSHVLVFPPEAARSSCVQLHFEQLLSHDPDDIGLNFLEMFRKHGGLNGRVMTGDFGVSEVLRTAAPGLQLARVDGAAVDEQSDGGGRRDRRARLVRQNNGLVVRGMTLRTWCHVFADEVKRLRRGAQQARRAAAVAKGSATAHHRNRARGLERRRKQLIVNRWTELAQAIAASGVTLFVAEVLTPNNRDGSNKGKRLARSVRAKQRAMCLVEGYDRMAAYLLRHGVLMVSFSEHSTTIRCPLCGDPSKPASCARQRGCACLRLRSKARSDSGGGGGHHCGGMLMHRDESAALALYGFLLSELLPAEQLLSTLLDDSYSARSSEPTVAAPDASPAGTGAT